MENVSKHIPILTNEVIALLHPESGKTYFDGTFGGGGHSRAILRVCEPQGRVVAVDRDPFAEQFATDLNDEFGDRFMFYNMPYRRVHDLNQQFDGAVLDLGMSTDQLQSSGRGFSFQKNEPLDLRFNPTAGQTAAQFLQQGSANEIERVFREYAEDRYSKKLASKIVNERRKNPIRSTSDFITYIGTDNPKVLAPLFQALRIQVNGEFEELKRGLAAVAAVLNRGAVMTVISFHSAEDRIVKKFFVESGEEILTKKPIVPGVEEITKNPSSRSAKLRAIRIVSG